MTLTAYRYLLTSPPSACRNPSSPASGASNRILVGTYERCRGVVRSLDMGRTVIEGDASAGKDSQHENELPCRRCNWVLSGPGNVYITFYSHPFPNPWARLMLGEESLLS